MKSKPFFRNLIPVIILFILVILSCLYFYPYAMEVPHRDSGIFLYVGREILNGKTIYTGAWDHKPPLIFWINALGLFLGKGSAWGVWGIEVLFLSTTGLLSFFLAKGKIRPIPRLLITTASFLAAFQYISGNFTEEYALVFQTAILFLFLGKSNKKKNFLIYFFIGILTGIAFNIKQTYIDVTIAIVLLLLLEIIIDKQWINIKYFAFIASGFLIPNLLVFTVMLLNNAVRDWWFAAYIFNFAYSDTGFLERIFALVDIFKSNLKYPFFVFAFITWTLAFFYIIYISIPYLIKFFFTQKGKITLSLATIFFIILLIVGQFMGTQPGIGVIESIVLTIDAISFLLFLLFTFILEEKNNDQRKPFRLTNWQSEQKAKMIYIHDPLMIGFFHFPMVLFLAATSGRNFPHYLIPLYSSFLLIFSGAYLIIKRINKNYANPKISTIILLLLFMIGVIQPGKKLIRGVGGPYAYNPYREIVQYIKENSDQDDTVLVWGHETIINYLSNRSSPTRFSHVLPLYYRSPLQQEARVILLDDITSNPPKLILDTRNPEFPFIDGVSKEECLASHPIDGSDLDKIIHFTCENYTHIDRINNIEIYERIEKP